MPRNVPLCVGLLFAFAVAGCGTDEKAVNAAAVAKRAQAQAERAATQADADAAKAQDLHDGCAQQMGDLLDKAKDLSSRLGVGLNYASYSEKAADVKVAYDDINFGSSDTTMLNCLTKVGLPLERAVNRYISAYKRWNRCVEDLNCDNDSITPSLQADWAKADRQVEKAKNGLEDLRRSTANARAKADKAQSTARQLAANARRLKAAAK